MARTAMRYDLGVDVPKDEQRLILHIGQVSIPKMGITNNLWHIN